MKNSLLLLSLFLSSLCTAQTTVSIRLNPTTGKDMALGSNPTYLAPDSLSTEIGAVQWTCGGNACELTSLFRFDLSSIPSNAIVTDARLSLFANPQQANGNVALGPMYGTANACTLFPLLSNWSYGQTTWVNYPSYTSINATGLPQSTTTMQDYLQLDVTASVIQMIANPSQNFGWMLKMDGSSYYNSMIFCSGDFSDSTKHPLLEITYTTGPCNEVRLHPVNGKDISFGSNPAYLAPDSLSTDLGAVQWTCGGNPCELRGAFQFDLSSIPAATVIQSAQLSLYANTAQANGNPSLGPMYGAANSCELLKITSPWQLSGISWSNQPAVSANDIITLTQSTASFQDYLNLDVTAIVQDWVNQPSQNYGWMIRMIGSSYYNSMIFCSSNFVDSTKHPMLRICYENTTSLPDQHSVSFNLFPNPSSDYISVQLNNHLSDVCQISLYDVTGKLARAENLYHQNGQSIQIDISSLAKGMYFINIKTADGLSATKRFIKN